MKWDDLRALKREMLRDNFRPLPNIKRWRLQCDQDTADALAAEMKATYGCQWITVPVPDGALFIFGIEFRILPEVGIPTLWGLHSDGHEEGRSTGGWRVTQGAMSDAYADVRLW